MDAPNFDHNSKLFSSAISLEKGSSSNRLGLICGTGGEPARPKDDYFCSTEKIAISSSSINIMIFLCNPKHSTVQKQAVGKNI